MITHHLTLFLFMSGILAGFVDSIAGGGGLITVPVLLLTGLSPHLTLGTNKLAATCGSYNAARIFIKKQIVQPRIWQYCIFATAVGACFGVLINQILSAEFLIKFLPFLIIAVAVYVGIYQPNKNNIQISPTFAPPTKIGSIIGLILGCYDGCFGPGTGSFWTFVAMSFFDLDLLTASGVARLMNFVSNITALIIFMLLSNVHYAIGLVMGMGLILGSYVGARSAIRYGAKFIRPIFLIVVISIAIHIAWRVW